MKKVDVYHCDIEALVNKGMDTLQVMVFGKEEAIAASDKVGAYNHAGTVYVDDNSTTMEALSAAYEKTQNVEAPWQDNEGVDCHVRRARSSMVGDVMIIDNKAYAVKSIGFAGIKEFSGLQKAPAKKHEVDDSPSP